MRLGKRNTKIFLHNAFIALLCVIWIIPIVWLVCTSFSAYSGMNTSTFFPEEWSIKHYQLLLTPDTVNQFPTWFWNTFVIACWTCIISTLFVVMVAYAMSVTRFKSRKALMNFAAPGHRRHDPSPVPWPADTAPENRSGQHHGPFRPDRSYHCSSVRFL